MKLAQAQGQEEQKGKIEKWLEELESSRQATSTPWIRLKAGETKVLTFDPDKVKDNPKDFKKDGKITNMMQFTVIDHSDNNAEKTIDFTAGWVRSIQALLSEGHRKLKVTRTGEGTKTSYTFVPVAN